VQGQCGIAHAADAVLSPSPMQHNRRMQEQRKAKSRTSQD
jgi:hypothetical protein